MSEVEHASPERAFLDAHSDAIQRFERLVQTLNAAQQVKYAYYRLKGLEVELTMDFVLEVETLTSALVIAYGRLFSETDGATKLRHDQVPDELKDTHRELIDLRNKRHAHHGAHPSVETEMRYSVYDDRVDVKISMNMLMCLGAPQHWEPLVEWLDTYLAEAVQQRLAHLSKVTGREWTWPPPEE